MFDLLGVWGLFCGGLGTPERSQGRVTWRTARRRWRARRCGPRGDGGDEREEEGEASKQNENEMKQNETNQTHKTTQNNTKLLVKTCTSILLATTVPFKGFMPLRPSDTSRTWRLSSC